MDGARVVKQTSDTETQKEGCAAAAALLPTVPEVIENLGVGFAQYRSTFVAGSVWLADGSELLLISSVAKAVAAEWDMTNFQRSVVVSLVFIGVMLGNAIGGPFSDVHGRRLPLLISLFSIFFFSILSATAWGFWSLCVIRLLVGISFGLGQPASMTLVNEITPASGRVLMDCVLQVMFSAGEIYSGLLIFMDDRYMQNLHWRSLLVLGALPSGLFFLLAYVFLYQSPLHLACCGLFYETHAVLETIRRDNGANHVPIVFKESGAAPEAHAPLRHQLRIIVGKELLATTVTVTYTCFVLNFVFYGCLYAFPQILVEVKMSGSPAVNLITGALWEVVAYIVAYFFGMSMGRISVMRVYLCLTSVSLLLFIAAATQNAAESWLWTSVLYAGYYGIKFFPSIGFIIVYLYVSEVYPTVVRSSGTAFSIAGGRLAAILAPLAYEGILSVAGGQYTAFFVVAAFLCIINLCLTTLLSFETAGKVLQDRVPTIEEESAGAAAYGSTRVRADFEERNNVSSLA